MEEKSKDGAKKGAFLDKCLPQLYRGGGQKGAPPVKYHLCKRRRRLWGFSPKRGLNLYFFLLRTHTKKVVSAFFQEFV